MRVRLLELLRCPTCPGALVARAARTATTGPGPTCRWACGLEDRPLEPADRCAACPTLDVLEGALECRSCAAVFPIRDGVPVLVAGGASADAEATRSVYARMRLSFGEPGPGGGQAEAWAENFRQNVGEVDARSFAGQLGVELGSGFGRGLHAASGLGAEVVGVDFSESARVARRNNDGNPRVHVVQADALRPPLRAGAFDFGFSFGVLHHTENPEAAFRSLVALVRPGGRVFIWVYGLEEMRTLYRLSHLRRTRALALRLPEPARLAICAALAVVFASVFVWPARLLERFATARPLVRRLPFSGYRRHGLRHLVTAFYDRLGVPIVHYHTRAEIQEWFARAALEQVRVATKDGHGWRASGVKPRE